MRLAAATDREASVRARDALAAARTRAARPQGGPFHMNKRPTSVAEVWQEYAEGLPNSSQPALRVLEEQHGNDWHRVGRTEHNPFDVREWNKILGLKSKRKLIWDEIKHVAATNNIGEDASAAMLQERFEAYQEEGRRNIPPENRTLHTFTLLIQEEMQNDGRRKRRPKRKTPPPSSSESVE